MTDSIKQKTLAFFFCLALFILYKQTVFDPYFAGNQPPVNPAPNSQLQASQPSGAAATTPLGTASAPVNTGLANPNTVPQAGAPVVTGANAAVSGHPTDSQIASAGLVSIETGKLTLKLSLLGGRLTEALLRDFASTIEKGSPRLNLIEHVEGNELPLGVYNGALSDEMVQYRVASDQGSDANSSSFVVDSNKPLTLTLKGSLPDGRGIEKALTFHHDGYLMDVAISVDAPDSRGSRLELEWTRLIPADSASLLDPYHVSGYVWFDGQKAQREAFSELKGDSVNFGNIGWLSMSDKYFMVGLISPSAPTPGNAIKTGELFRARLAGTDRAGEYKIFLGPKSYRLLNDAGFELHRNINFGKTGFISAPLLSLLHFFYGLLGNYGLAIVCLTILVKAALFPLNSTSFKQMKAMQEIQPEVKRIRETITDKQQQQLEMMSLYKKRGVNPLGGCLPILLQMPIFIGLYSALMLAVELRHAPFALWVHDLSAPEKLMLGGFGIPVMVLLFITSMLIQQWITPSNIDPTQKKMMMVMPLIFGFMFAKMPAGLTLYYLTNNLISIGQQRAIQGKGGKSAVLVTASVSLAVFLFAFALVKLGN